MAEVKTPLKVCISLVAASLLVVAYYLVAGKIEKRKVDELISTSACSWVGKGLLLGKLSDADSINLWSKHLYRWRFWSRSIYNSYNIGNVFVGLVHLEVLQISETIEGTIIPIWPVFSNISHPHK